MNERLRVAERSGRPLIVIAAVPEALDAQARRRLARLGWAVRPDGRTPVESLTGHALVRRLLSGWLGVALDDVWVEVAPGGRPYAVVADGRTAPGFSLSHSGDLVAAALVADGTIGIDLELVRDFDPRLPARVFAPPDARRVLALPAGQREREFARLWTVAEACAKATGEGLRRLLRRCGRIGAGATGTWDGGPLSWAVAEPVDGYSCAVASDVLARVEDITGFALVSLDWIMGDATGTAAESAVPRR